MPHDPDNRFAQLMVDLGKPGCDPVSLIRKGLPATLLADAATYLGLPVTRLRSLAGVSPHTAQALASRKGALDASASERIWRLADVTALALRAFPGEEAAVAWLRAPHPVFGHTAPFDWLDTEPGAASVRRVLTDMSQAQHPS
ncbi:antitoxin Xre-like helix-turn-helix domain-containing protein [Pseudoduganella sp. GCM10020061]|uniref:antitoxin Xre-like helix-turn-helix domain-containing protein n=1 Tax=Pseudoduganella sp. GCM10020061 TaxID=3317345 RepID=UPI003631C275